MLPYVLPSFLPSVLPSFLPSFLNSFLPSFIEHRTPNIEHFSILPKHVLVFIIQQNKKTQQHSTQNGNNNSTAHNKMAAACLLVFLPLCFFARMQQLHRPHPAPRLEGNLAAAELRRSRACHLAVGHQGGQHRRDRRKHSVPAVPGRLRQAGLLARG